MSNQRQARPPITGKRFAIVCCEFASGRSPATSFIEELDARHYRELAVVESNLWLLANEGLTRNEQKFKHIKGDIYEVKGKEARIFMFFDPARNTWFLIDGFLKKRQTFPKGLLERIETMRAEFIQHRAQADPEEQG
jgi:hypothetical protein